MISGPSSSATGTDSEKVIGSYLPLRVICAAVRFYNEASMSLHAASTATAIAIEVLDPNEPSPSDAIGLSNNTVQNMNLRLGLYEISRPKEMVSDRIWIVDHTITVGTTKCFLVLGIRLEKFRQLGRPLEHSDMEVLALIPVEQSTGDIVHGQYSQLAQQCGVPYGILSDHGSDLKKGGELFQQENPNTLLCYDIVHAVSRMIERILSRDDCWNDYRKACCQCANKVRQSKQAHLKPPKPKTKARYMNVSPEIDWGVNVLGLLNRARRASLSPAQQASLDPKKLQTNFGWLNDYRVSLAFWWLLCKIGKSACTVVRKHGYNRDLGEQMRAAIALPKNERAAELVHEIYRFSDNVAKQFGDKQAVPGSSEIIESVIGKGKRFMGYQSGAGMTRQILAMATSVVTPTAEYVRSALKACRIKHIAQWCDEHLPESIQAARKRDLNSSKIGTKPAPAPSL